MFRAHLTALVLSLAVTGALVALRPVFGLAAVALVYMLLVFLSAVWLGRGPSLVASFLAFLGLNFLFTAPYTFLVTSIQEAISLLVFLLVAETTSRLVARLRHRELEAARHDWEVSTLHAMSDATTASHVPEDILQALPGLIVEHLGVPECVIYLPDTAGTLRPFSSAARTPGATTSPGTVPESAARAFVAREPVEDTGFSLPLAVGEHVVGILHVKPPDGGRLPEVTERLLMTFAGQAAALIERLRLRREAAEAELLRRTDELKSSLLSAVSHDLRTPLASIRMAATALLGKNVRWGEKDRRELLESIDTEAARLSRLVGNLLDLSRLEAGVLRPLKAWNDLREVVARAVDHLRGRGGEQRMLEVNIPPDVPLVSFDFTQIEDVLVNLLDNAVRHSPEGTEIRISASRRGREIVVQVDNDGPPIPAEAAEHIFSRFYALPESRGTAGLGLAICKGLIEAHDGRIWVERPGDPGARIAFALPLEELPTEVGERPSRTT